MFKLQIRKRWKQKHVLHTSIHFICTFVFVIALVNLVNLIRWPNIWLPHGIPIMWWNVTRVLHMRLSLYWTLVKVDIRVSVTYAAWRVCTQIKITFQNQIKFSHPKNENSFLHPFWQFYNPPIRLQIWYAGLKAYNQPWTRPKRCVPRSKPRQNYLCNPSCYSLPDLFVFRTNSNANLRQDSTVSKSVAETGPTPHALRCQILTAVG